MPAGIGGPNTVVRFVAGNNEAIQQSAIPAPVLDAANRFYKTQANYMATGVVDFHHKVQPYSDLDGTVASLDFLANHGYISLTVRMLAIAGVAAAEWSSEHMTDISLDGYIAFCIDFWRPSVVSAKVTITVNGQIVFDRVMASFTNDLFNQVFLFPVGKEGLRYQSMSKHNPNKLLRANVPALKPANLFAYPMYYYDHTPLWDAANPDTGWYRYVLEPDEEFYVPGTSADHVVYTNSATVAKGMNNVTIAFSRVVDEIPMMTDSSGNYFSPVFGADIYLWTEFYDRTALRSVMQSWHHAFANNSTIIVNDTPTVFGAQKSMFVGPDAVLAASPPVASYWVSIGNVIYWADEAHTIKSLEGEEFLVAVWSDTTKTFVPTRTTVNVPGAGPTQSVTGRYTEYAGDGTVYGTLEPMWISQPALSDALLAIMSYQGHAADRTVRPATDSLSLDFDLSAKASNYWQRP